MDSLLLELEKEVIKTEINKIYDILYIKNLLEKSIKENCHLSQYNLAKYYFNEKKNVKQATIGIKNQQNKVMQKHNIVLLIFMQEVYA